MGGGGHWSKVEPQHSRYNLTLGFSSNQIDCSLLLSQDFFFINWELLCVFLDIPSKRQQFYISI